MKCPNCGGDKHYVLRTIPYLEDSIPRERICNRCKYYFKTTETIDEEYVEDSVPVKN
jgi:transcriptional regulator NrdR family protein